MTYLTHEDYTVGWICALPLEMAAAKAMLDEVHEDLPVQSHDHNAYTLGRIGKHNIVISCLPSGQYGIAPASSVATQLLSSFPSIRFGLLVGIGGGVPNENVDIRLGDIVVGLPTSSSPHGGVVQYDFGKVISGGKFQRTGILNSPPQILLTAVAKLQATHQMERSRAPYFVEEIGRKYPAMRDTYTRRQLKDELFDARYSHPDPRRPCSSCDPTRVIERADRLNSDPVIHYGLIASGNQVVKDSQFRDRLARELGAYCVEMEAAGLLNNFPCLVIRGICDYADSHKNNGWQGYAATVAAAYAKELLLVTSESPVIRLMKPSNAMHRSNFNDSSANVLEKRKLAYLQSLGPPIIHVQRPPPRNSMERGWGDMFSNREYDAWSRGKNMKTYQGLIWIKGKPGSGKSTFMKHAFHQVSEALPSNGTSVAGFFFHGQGKDLQWSPLSLFQTLLYQLFQANEDDLLSFMDAFEYKLSPRQKIIEWTEEELKSYFSSMFTQRRSLRTVLFLDGLDQCHGNGLRELAFFFRRLTTTAHSVKAKLSVCLSSREYPKVSVANCPEILIHHFNTADIRHYVQQKFLAAGINRDTHWRELETTIISRSIGVFLWVIIVVDGVLNDYDEGRSFQNIQNRLQNVPPALEQLYATALQIERQIRAISKGLVEVKMKETCLPADDGNSICAYAGSLDSEEGEARVVQVIHGSVSEYFLYGEGFNILDPSTRAHALGVGDLNILNTCLDYIFIPELDNLVLQRQQRDIINRHGPGILDHDNLMPGGSDFPPQTWKHQDAYDLNTQSSDSLVLSNSESRQGMWQQRGIYKRSGSEASFGSSASSYAASAHSTQPKEQIPSPKPSITFSLSSEDSGPEPPRSPIRTAMDADSLSESSNTPFTLERFLCDVTAVAEIDDVERATSPSNWTHRSDDSQMLEDFPALLFYTVDAFTVHAAYADKNGTSPKNLLDRLKYENIWRRWLYLAEGISFDTTLMGFAAAQGLTSWVKYLLSLESRPNMPALAHSDSLISAVRNGQAKIIGLLLKGGADARNPLGQKVPDGKSLLHHIAQEGRVELLFCLPGSTPLYGDIVGVLINEPDIEGKTPLHLAVQKPHVAMTEILMVMGANPNLFDIYGNTPLHYACQSERPNLTVCYYLLARGANKHPKNKKAFTPAQLAFRKGFYAAVSLLNDYSTKEAKLKDGDGLPKLTVRVTAVLEYNSLPGPYIVASLGPEDKVLYYTKEVKSSPYSQVLSNHVEFRIPSHHTEQLDFRLRNVHSNKDSPIENTVFCVNFVDKDGIAHNYTIPLDIRHRTPVIVCLSLVDSRSGLSSE